jgi:hypothetical protein
MRSELSFSFLIMGCTFIIAGAILTGTGFIAMAISPTAPSFLALSGMVAQFGGAVLTFGSIYFAKNQKN